MNLSRWWGLAIFVVLFLLAQSHSKAQKLETQPLSQSAQQFLNDLPSAWLQNDDALWVPGEILVGRSATQAVRSTPDVKSLLGFQPKILRSFLSTNKSNGTAITIERWQVPTGSEWNIIAALQNQPGILFAEPNWTVRAALQGTIPTPTSTATPTRTSTPIGTTIVSPTNNSSATPVQPYVPNDALYLDRQWYLQRINAPRALALLDNGDGKIVPVGEIVVAVIDSGLDLTHPEFAGRILPGYNFWDNSLDPDMQSCALPEDTLAPVVDDFGHGSHVTGLIGSALNNQRGLASVAPFIKIQPLKILNGNGSGTVFDLATAITYAATCLHVHIINMSLEISASVLDNNPVLNNTLHTAIQGADAQNVLMIAAGGNSGGSVVPYPAAYAEVMGVAALNIENQRTSYSTSGSEIDIAAPGGESTTSGGTRMYSTWSKDAESKCRDGSYQLLDGGAYCNDHGTSMATPLVAGVAALVWGVDPELTAHEVRNILLESATPLGLPTNQIGKGRVDAHAALRRVLKTSLTLTQNNYQIQAGAAASEVRLLVRLENASSQSLEWKGTVITGSNWISLEEVGTKTLTATVAYGSPSFLHVVISPTVLAAGEHNGTVEFQALDSDNHPLVTQLTIRISIDAGIATVTLHGAALAGSPQNRLLPDPLSGKAVFVTFFPIISAEPAIQLFLPVIALNGDFNPLPTSTPTSIPTATPTVTPVPSVPSSSPPAVAPTAVIVPFAWETPAIASDRTVYSITSELPAEVTFPGSFSFPMRGDVYQDFRIFANGYVAFPKTEPGADGDNHCLLNIAEPGQAIYGWWTALDPTASGSQISTFAVGTDRYVVEFNNVPSLSASPGYRVSFQIVMFSNGDIRLNYLSTPDFDRRPSPVTVGVEAHNALFGFQIACSTDSLVVDNLPQSGQSFLIKADYLF